jgi:hypothetical protein
MRDRDKPAPPLVAAAEALDAELQRLEALVVKSGKEPLTSRKSFERAARTLGAMTELEGCLRDALARMVGALEQAGGRQQGAMEALSARAKELEARYASFCEVVKQRDELGAHGVRVNELIRGLMAAPDGGGLPQALAEVGRVQDESEALFSLAKERGFNDVAREVDSVRQQLGSLRRKLAVAAGQPAPPEPTPQAPLASSSDEVDEVDAGADEEAR